MLKLHDIEKKVYLACPNPRRNVNHKVFGGDFYYLGSYLFNRHYEVFFDCGYDRNDQEIKLERLLASTAQFLIIDLFRTELLEEDRITSLVSQLRLINEKAPSVRIILMGPISTVIRDSGMLCWLKIESVINEMGVHKQDGTTITALESDLQSFYRKEDVRLNFDFLQKVGIVPQQEDLFYVASSWGCNNRCSFCAYNRDTAHWHGRQIEDVVKEIKETNKRWGIHKVSLTDNNFGNNVRDNLRRLKAFQHYLDKYELSITLTLNAIIDGINQEVASLMASVGVKTVLIGIESFNPYFLRRKFSKSVSFDKAKNAVSALEEQGIVPVLSFILFHPWHTVETLLEEIKQVECVGRAKFVHYAAKSVLKVVPGTAMENRLQQEGLLIKNKLNRSFRFQDQVVAEIYRDISAYTTRHLKRCKHHRDYNQLKIDEWIYLKQLCKHQITCT